MSKLSMRGQRWRNLAAQIIDRDGGRCIACGATEDLTVDHVIPLAQMDDDDRDEGLHLDPTNLQTLCRTCNGRKTDTLTTRRTWLNPRWLA